EASTNDMQRIEHSAAAASPPTEVATKIERLLASLAGGLLDGAAFEFQLPDHPPRRIGQGELAFRLVVHNQQAVSAPSSLDELRIGEAYLNGDLDLEGDLVAALNLRTRLTDSHPLRRLWSIYGQRLLFGQVNRDKKWISEHYDSESDFYLL